MGFMVWIGQVRFETVLFVYLTGMVCGFLVAAVCRSKEGFLAWWTALSGAGTLVELSRKAKERELCFFLALAAVAVGVGELLLFAVFALRKWGERRAMRRAESFRSLEYGLPEQGNEYLRRRLDEGTRALKEERQETGVDLEYVRALLAKLKGAKLAAVEKLRAEELSKQITVYALKEGLTAEERVCLGECFSAVIALAAKHGV